MAEVKTIQDRLEQVAKDKLEAKIKAVKKIIYDSGLSVVLDKFYMKVDDRSFTVNDLFSGYGDKALYKKAEELLLPDLINTEVHAFISKVDSLAEQVEDLRNYQGGQY